MIFFLLLAPLPTDVPAFPFLPTPRFPGFAAHRGQDSGAGGNPSDHSINGSARIQASALSGIGLPFFFFSLKHIAGAIIYDDN
ncbi:MAG: hypothetical protein ACO1N5_15595 [Noviherbaspirillum sp.]